MTSTLQPSLHGFNEDRLVKLLDRLKKEHKIGPALRELARMKIPVTFAKQHNLLESIEQFKNNPATEKMVAIIERKHQKMIETNKMRRDKCLSKGRRKVSFKIPTASTKHAPAPTNPNTLPNGTQTSARNKRLRNMLTTPLRIEIPERRVDNNFISNDLLAQRPQDHSSSIQQLLGLGQHIQMNQAAAPGQPLKFGPGLQVSEPSAFRPFARRRPTFAEVYNSPLFQEIYRLVVAEDEARRAVAHPTVDQILDEMSMMNAPFLMLRSNRLRQQQQSQGTSSNN